VAVLISPEDTAPASYPSIICGFREGMLAATQEDTTMFVGASRRLRAAGMVSAGKNLGELLSSRVHSSELLKYFSTQQPGPR